MAAGMGNISRSRSIWRASVARLSSRSFKMRSDINYKQTNLFRILRQPDHSLKLQSQLFKKFGRGMVVWRCNRHDTLEPQNNFSIRHHGGSRLIGIPSRPESPEKCESDIHIFQGVSFDQTTDPDRDTALLQHGQVKAEAQSVIHVYWPV